MLQRARPKGDAPYWPGSPIFEAMVRLVPILALFQLCLASSYMHWMECSRSYVKDMISIYDIQIYILLYGVLYITDIF